ncbi:RluA family pseudouridine synthase [Microgenomates group bacterium]|nr:RluA family pseudouridine synthase [Microgenomates group bacterium]
MTPEIVYEDEDVVAVNKEAGVVVNRSATYQGETLQDWWREKYLSECLSATNWSSLTPEDWTADYGEAEEIIKERGGVAHRLDKDTSGVLLLAKNAGALINLLMQFKQRKISKTYECLVHGRMNIEEDRVSLPLGRKAGNRLQFAVRSDGKAAVTFYKVVKKYQGIDAGRLKEVAKEQSLKKINDLYQGFSEVEFRPQTGRTHQLRVHMAHLGHPLVGDKLYAPKNKVKMDRLWCPRQFLHAKRISFTHPRTGKEVVVTAKLTRDLVEAKKWLAPS